jgi:NAD-specific glutamate dehydrogenase
MNKAAEIADLFMDKFRPNGLAISEEVYKNREVSLKDSIEKIQSKTARAVLQKMLETTTATLRTNFFLPHRFYILFFNI